MFKSENSFLVLYTTSVQQTQIFFSKLGVQIKQLEDDKVVVSFGGFDLHYILNTTEPNPKYEYIADPVRYGQGVIFYLETDDIHAAQQKIVEAGGTIKASVFTNHWGYSEVLFEDPNGYKFALYQELK